MNIFLGADHRGFHLKEALKTWLETEGYTVVDCGGSSYNVADDYPDYALAAADRVAADKPGDAFGIVICGSGIGVVIAANKVKGIRCAYGMNLDVVEHSRMHDDCNVLGLAADLITEEEAKTMVKRFLTTPFESQERFTRRIQKITAREL